MRSFGYREAWHMLVSSSCATALVLSVSAAIAAPPKPSSKAAPSSSQFTLRREEAGGPSAASARAKVLAGDCAGALSLFDDAINHTIEPTLRRDRGLCHEKLGHPYPAIDDYRAYLVAMPDAPDAEQFRDRLARLEASVGIGGRSRAAAEESGNVDSSVVTANESETGAKATAKSTGESYDDDKKARDLADDAEQSPLRKGKGFILGAFVHVPRYFFSKEGTSDLGYGVGATFRYSFGPTWSFMSEIGYAGIGKFGSDVAAGGVLLFAGMEARLPLSKYASDQIVLGLGFDFERQLNHATQIGGDFVGGRARAGYRHVFGPELAVEAALDGGYGEFVMTNKPAIIAGDNESLNHAARFIGGTFAVLVGF
ncbi:MAG: tetratricopeptide repeat protein [Polyangiaceae bacterium]|nr:tetratricopeptide repeat protein [Polyangiaceae bacterium]